MAPTTAHHQPLAKRKSLKKKLHINRADSSSQESRQSNLQNARNPFQVCHKAASKQTTGHKHEIKDRNETERERIRERHSKGLIKKRQRKERGAE